MTKEHVAPWDCVLAKENDNVCLPGRRPGTDQEHFEILCLCLLQAGLNWNTIRNSWGKYRHGFDGFDIGRLAEASPEELLTRPDVLRNVRKLEAVVHNAREFLALAVEHGSFAGYLDTLDALEDEPRVKTLTQRFKGVGPEVGGYFLHAVGRV